MTELKMTENDIVRWPKITEDCKRYYISLTKNDYCKRYPHLSLTEFTRENTVNILCYYFYLLKTGNISSSLYMFTVLRSMIKGWHIYSTQKSFFVILILVVTFTVVIFCQIQSKKIRNFHSLLVWSSLFGYLYLVIFIWSALSSHLN